mmetsp:Transcript_24698/g.51253  ORF Transcript_24698/g.51253 Transcript_24698/m.51253 type:complete len:136 (-) Transcript_24698:219-626(-)|eukprot:CAMPEP_0171345288 /NCGR_PEP_ID=MMETSP0878-20121228/21140_1 /TAXON_ID=67004 /ORGANISM="Thalassiosira weissflogii, Strain CCMP1336" /LENGTH=135 /DNA_ID=CAMNT_0011848655 /DNA_START=153 /DNA_END=560 /DNA_ORIENTATION=+
MPFWSSSNPNSGDSPDDSDPINDLIEKSKPILEKLTFSSFMGYCSAVSAKKIGKSVAFIVGLSFIGLQSLAHMGYIAVDWKKVEKSAMDLIDTDNDGKITEKDVKKYWSKVKVILTNKVPDAGGFLLGFFYGLRD